MERALRVEALEAVPAKRIALRLHALRRVEDGRAQRVIVRERSHERGGGEAVRSGGGDRPSPPGNAAAHLGGDGAIEQQVGEGGVGGERGVDKVEHARADDAAAAPDLRESESGGGVSCV